jgi:hypothetical protein
MTETIKPDPTDPFDPVGEGAPKPQPSESFLAPGDADAGETGGSEGEEEPEEPKQPLPPD